MTSVGVRMASNGRLVIPVEIRTALDMAGGGDFVATVEDGAIVLVPLDEAIRRVQEKVARHVPAGRSLADELIEDRRREAALE